MQCTWFHDKHYLSLYTLLPCKCILNADGRYNKFFSNSFRTPSIQFFWCNGDLVQISPVLNGVTVGRAWSIKEAWRKNNQIDYWPLYLTIWQNEGWSALATKRKILPEHECSYQASGAFHKLGINQSEKRNMVTFLRYEWKIHPTHFGKKSCMTHANWPSLRHQQTEMRFFLYQNTLIFLIFMKLLIQLYAYKMKLKSVFYFHLKASRSSSPLAPKWSLGNEQFSSTALCPELVVQFRSIAGLFA